MGKSNNRKKQRGKTRAVGALVSLLTAGSMLSGVGLASANMKALKVIDVATQSPLSGPQASMGQDIERGAQMAVNADAAQMAKLGFKVQFVPYDDQAIPQIGASNAQKIAQNSKILAVVGHLNSGVALAALPIYNAANLAMVSPANTNVKITTSGYKAANRIVGRDDVQGGGGADFAAKTLKAKSVYIIQDKTAYGEGIALAFEAEAEKDGMKVLGFTGITSGQTDFSSVLDDAQVLNPDVIYYGGVFSDGALLLKQARDKGITAKFISDDGFDDPADVQISGSALVGAYFSTTAGPTAATAPGRVFIKRYEKQYGQAPGSYAAYGYDAMGVALQGIENAIKADHGKTPTRAQVETTIRHTKNYKGIVTNVTFNGIGDNIYARVFIEQFKTDTYPATVLKILE